MTIVVSAGIQSVQVPSLTNKTQQEAANELASVGLQVGNVTTEYSDNYAAGRVIRQGITQGKTVDAGTSVDLVISDGKNRSITVIPAASAIHMKYRYPLS